MELSQRRTLLIGRLRRRKTREREGLVLVEGVRAVGEALDCGAQPRFAVCSARVDTVQGGGEVLRRLTAADVEILRLDEGDFEELSDTERSQGLLAVFPEPRHGMEIIRAGGRYLILDAVQDPGNVGTLVRAASAFALDGVLVLDGTVDPWGAKAVRASAGMVFRVPLAAEGMSEVSGAMVQAGVLILVADAGGQDVSDSDVGESWALVVGNEGSGPRPEWTDVAADTVRVPMSGATESLNAAVAGAILLYALSQEMRSV